MELPEGTRVLVIEDNESNRRLARAMLGQLGCEILEAADAEAGLALARTARPAVILLDLHLPGMDGLEAARALKQDPDTRDIKLLAVTALAMPGDRERALAAGCDGYVSKPVRYQELFVELQRLMHTAVPA